MPLLLVNFHAFRCVRPNALDYLTCTVVCKVIHDYFLVASICHGNSVHVQSRNQVDSYQNPETLILLALDLIFFCYPNELLSEHCVTA